MACRMSLWLTFFRLDSLWRSKLRLIVIDSWDIYHSISDVGCWGNFFTWGNFFHSLVFLTPTRLRLEKSKLTPTRLRLEKSKFRALVLKAKLKQDTSQHGDNTSAQDRPEKHHHLWLCRNTSSSGVYVLWGSQSMRQEYVQHQLSCWQRKGEGVHHCNLSSPLATKEERPLHRRLREGYPGAPISSIITNQIAAREIEISSVNHQPDCGSRNRNFER